jgi:hypothetical protein
MQQADGRFNQPEPGAMAFCAHRLTACVARLGGAAVPGRGGAPRFRQHLNIPAYHPSPAHIESGATAQNAGYEPAIRSFRQPGAMLCSKKQ